MYALETVSSLSAICTPGIYSEGHKCHGLSCMKHLSFKINSGSASIFSCSGFWKLVYAWYGEWGALFSDSCGHCSTWVSGFLSQHVSLSMTLNVCSLISPITSVLVCFTIIHMIHVLLPKNRNLFPNLTKSAWCNHAPTIETICNWPFPPLKTSLKKNPVNVKLDSATFFSKYGFLSYEK